MFKNVDCIELYVSDLDDGIKYYCDGFGLKLLWRAETTAGLGMENDISEIVLQTERRRMNVDFKVDSVIDTIAKVEAVGGRVVGEPFDIPIGKCAVVQDRWGNEYVILDITKGTYDTDEFGNVIGVS